MPKRKNPWQACQGVVDKTLREIQGSSGASYFSWQGAAKGTAEFELRLRSRRVQDCGCRVKKLRLLCFCPGAIGLGRKFIIVVSVIEQPCLHGPGCRRFRDPPGSSCLPPIIGRGVRRYLPTPSRKKCFLPFHLIFPLWLRRSLAWSGDRNGTTQLSYLQINHPRAPAGLNRAIWLVLSRPNVCCLMRGGAQTDVILWLRKAQYWSGRTKGCY